MTLLEAWVQTPVASALGWTLFHSLWQGAVAALALGTVLVLARSARVRYWAACVALGGMLVCCAVTFLRQNAQPHVERVTVSQARVHVPAAGVLAQPAANDSSPWRAADFLPWLVPFWFAGACIFHLRGVAGWMVTRRLRRTGVCCAPEAWQRQCALLRERLSVSRPVVVLESCLAEVPVVIGCVRPVILLPLGMLAGMPPAQVELILLHELAHVGRYDDLVNLLQAFAEGLLFYHPAAWWISRVIRAERENCCDDAVVAAGASAGEYARALTVLEQSRLTACEPALAATGGHLGKRIRRLLYPAEAPRVGWVPILCTGLLMLGATVLAGWQQQPPPPAHVRAEAHMRAALAIPYRRWLDEDVVYIITDGERAEYRSLQTDTEREQFIERFWKRRDPTPGTPENEFKEEHYRRIAYANDRFGFGSVPGWKSDRGKTYIIFGPPDEHESHPGGVAGTPQTAPFEIWRYNYIEQAGRDVTLTFLDSARSGEYLWVEKRTGDLPTVIEVFSSIEPGVKVRLRVMPDRQVFVAIPLDFAATSYNIYGRTTTAGGRNVWIFEDTVGPQSRPGLEYYAKFGKSERLPPGGYVFHAVVKGGTTLKTYTVNFSVK